MPTTVSQLFLEVEKEILGKVKWGQTVNCNDPGVYVVAIAPTAEEMVCCDKAPISKELVEKWIDYVPRMCLDYSSPSTEALVQRLSTFWIPDETILYIGKAGTSLRNRVRQYYKTRLGDPKPHRGGHWLKTLNNLDELSIYWTTSDGETAHDVESRFLKAFVQNVSQVSKGKLYDSEHTFPFANLEFPRGTRKKHMIQRQAR